MNRKSRLLPILLSVVLLTVACSKVPTRTTSTVDGPAGRQGEFQTVRVLAVGQDPTLDAMVSAFHAKYPTYRVDKVTVGLGGGGGTPGGAGGGTTAILEGVMAQITSGEVDVIPTRFTSSLPTSSLLALDPFIQKNGFDMKPFGASINQLRVEGKLYELPYAVFPQLLTYNRDLFQSANVPAPKAGWTWEQFREAAMRLTKGSGDTKVWGFTTTSMEQMLEAYLIQRSGSLANADERALREAFQLFSTMVLTDQSSPAPVSRNTAGGEGGRAGIAAQIGATFGRADPFTSGRAAMNLQSVGGIGRINRQYTFQWDVAPMPTLPGSKAAVQATPQSYAINAQSKNPDAAWRFVSFLAGADGALAVAKAGMMPLYRTPAAKQAYIDSQGGGVTGYEELFKLEFSFANPLNINSLTAQLPQALRRAANDALTGSKPWEQALADYLVESKQIRDAAR